MPQVAGIVRHHVCGARDVIMYCHLAMGALVHGIETCQIRRGGRQRGGAFVGPRERSLIVRGHPERAFSHGLRL